MYLEKKYTNDNIFPKKVESISEPNTTTSLSIGKDEAEKRLLAEGFKDMGGSYDKYIEDVSIYVFEGTYSIYVISEKFKLSSYFDSLEISYDCYDESDKPQVEPLHITEELDCNKQKCKSVEDYAKYINHIKKLLK